MSRSIKSPLSLFLLIFLFAPTALAQQGNQPPEEEEESSWTGKGELGYVHVSGNTESETINAGFEMEKNAGNWHHITKASAVRTQNNEIINGESYSAGWRSEYSFSERTFGFGDIRYFDDKFDSFTGIYTLAFGVGYKVLKREGLKWDLSAGVGYRDTEIDETVSSTVDGDHKGVTYLLESDYRHTLTESTKLENYTRVEISDDNTFSQNVAGLSIKINSSLALKIQYDVRHNSDPEPGFTKTDKITSVNIVYSF